MRLKFSGSARPPGPIVLNLANGVPFLKQPFVDQGYTQFDVICIGGGGGEASFYHDPSSLNGYCGGGAGGGGGAHLVSGALSSLADSTAVVVGNYGSNGVNISPSNQGSNANGGDGGYSSFGGSLCKASGGKGGRASTFGLGFVPGTGGEGGIGDQTTAGGGAAGSVWGTGPHGADGVWNGAIGSGGGGGNGGYYYKSSGVEHYTPASAGGRGNYSALDDSVSGGAGEVGLVYSYGSQRVTYPHLASGYPLYAGPGGGAKALPINGLADQYGYGGIAGAVILRLTA